MSAGPTVSLQKIIAGTRNNPDLRDALTQMAQAAQQQQTVTGTTPQANSTPGQANPNAARPSQATGYVSVLKQNSQNVYVVQLVNPGGKSPTSQLQAQQAAGSATSLTSLQPVTPIYHQIRASTSPAFNVNSNTQTFGGDTGSTQTYWTLTGLGSGTWYIQFRSSYDGINWNAWKNANGGTGLGGLVSQVTVENQGNAEWAVFSLPGGLILGIGAAELVDQEVFNLATEVYSSGMLAIAGPNGFGGQGNAISGFTMSDVDLETPEVPAAGIPDYPVIVRMRYAIAQTQTDFPANASVFAIAFDPTNENVKLYTEPSGSGNATWAVMRLPGGARIAIGQGQNKDGDTIWTPSLSWFSTTRMMSIGALTDAALNQQPITGVNAASIDSTGKVSASYLDTSGNPVTGQKMNWMAIAWENGAPVQTVGGHQFLTIALQGGHAVVIGAGQTASGTAITFPTGYTSGQQLGIAVPGGSDNTGHHLRGIQECALIGDFPTLTYTDNTNTWAGNVNWLAALWK